MIEIRSMYDDHGTRRAVNPCRVKCVKLTAYDTAEGIWCLDVDDEEFLFKTKKTAVKYYNLLLWAPLYERERGAMLASQE